MRLHSGLLIDVLDLPRVECEALLGFTAENEHICGVELDATAGLRTHELTVDHLELHPAHASDDLAILATVLVPLELRLRASVELLDAEVAAELGFSVRARHKVDPPLVHHHGSSVDS